MDKIGVYIHIPFCKQKCYYCDFISFKSSTEIQKKYIEALLKEIENFFEKNNNFEIETIYIGGGTPSFINSEHIVSILRKIYMYNKKASEITIEINPGTITKKKLEDYKNVGINRISLGLQSKNNKILKEIGRIHTYEEFLTAYKMVQELKFSNINVDLMIGLPNQTIADVKETLENILNLAPKHVSLYSLIVEEDTKIFNLIENEILHLPSEEDERKMYWCAKEMLENNGFKQYEISNFALSGYEAKHNLDCWEQKEYIRIWFKCTFLFKWSKI